MRLPRPSPGSCVLAVALAAGPLTYAWIERPFWFERAEPQRTREHAAYLVRLAAAAADPRHRDLWAQRAIAAAVDGAGRLGVPDLVHEVLADLERAGALPADVRELAAASCWSQGVDATGALTPGQPVLVFAHNTTAAARALQLDFAGPDGAKLTTLATRGAPEAIEFAAGAGRCVVHVDAGAFVGVTMLAATPGVRFVASTWR